MAFVKPVMVPLVETEDGTNEGGSAGDRTGDLSHRRQEPYRCTTPRPQEHYLRNYTCCKCSWLTTSSWGDGLTVGIGVAGAAVLAVAGSGHVTGTLDVVATAPLVSEVVDEVFTSAFSFSFCSFS